jgi:HEPN domain-containing protein
MEFNASNGFQPAMSTCMHAQQYAEKMIKEKYVELFDSEPDRTHNLKILIGQILPEDYKVDADIILKAGMLSSYYMASRYPDYGGTKEITEETAEEAYRWSLEIVGLIDRIHRDADGKIVIDTTEAEND